VTSLGHEEIHGMVHEAMKVSDALANGEPSAPEKLERLKFISVILDSISLREWQELRAERCNCKFG
jgi:hypothetical protein